LEGKEKNMATENKILDLSYEAAEDLSSDRYRIVVLDTGKVRRPNAAGDVPFGVLQNAPESGEAASVRVMGVSKVVFGETVVENEWIKLEYVDAADAGKGMDADVEGDLALGRCLVGGAEDELGEILLTGGVYRTTHAAKSIPVSLGSLVGEDGTALAQFSDGDSATPGWAQLSNKELVLRWNNHATPSAVSFSVAMPSDLDAGEDVEIHWLAAMSGANDTPEITTEAYFNDGDTDCAGTDDEIDGGATLTEYVNVIDAADVPAAPAALTVNFKPKAGELGTDDCFIHAVWVEYTATV
jgi:hypothetical protein